MVFFWFEARCVLIVGYPRLRRGHFPGDSHDVKVPGWSVAGTWEFGKYSMTVAPNNPHCVALLLDVFPQGVNQYMSIAFFSWGSLCVWFSSWSVVWNLLEWTTKWTTQYFMARRSIYQTKRTPQGYAMNRIHEASVNQGLAMDEWYFIGTYWTHPVAGFCLGPASPVNEARRPNCGQSGGRWIPGEWSKAKPWIIQVIALQVNALWIKLKPIVFSVR